MKFTKRQTVNFTVEGHVKLKELTKRHGVNQYMMVDALIASVDEESPAFLEQIELHIKDKTANKRLTKEVTQAVNEATAGMTPEEVVALLEKAKQL